MSFKLAFKNIKKSIKDYSIYFFTLVIGVSIFYIFNSLDAQKSVMVMSESKSSLVASLVMLLSYVSVFISFVLGFLIIYSNKFLIKRRKKEFGLYLVLGMSKRKVSFILVVETLIIGILSLGAGLILGVFLSQFLSIFTAKLFEANMGEFRFVFSELALIKTIIYFSIIFILVMIFNVITISKQKLINLLNAGKQNEKIKIRNKWVTILTFLLSIVFLGYAYKLLFNGVLFTLDESVIYMIISGSIGTFLLFYSIAGFFLRIFEKIKKVYYKNLNMFVLKQVNNKVNTTVFSTTIICLMLLLTICILSGSLSLANLYNDSLTENNKTDFTILSYESNCVVTSENVCEYKKVHNNILDIINKSKYKDSLKEYEYYQLYTDEDLTLDKFIDSETMESIKKEYGDSLELNGGINIISETDYNNIMELYGTPEKKLNINKNEYVLTASSEKPREFYKNSYESGNKIEINGNYLTPKSKEIINENFQNYTSESNFGTIVVDDTVIENGLELYANALIGNYIEMDNVEKFDSDFIDSIRSEGYSFDIITKIKMKETSVGIKAIMVFVGLYLGIIFAISSATILAIQNLSESSDNKIRYKILRLIGTEEKMISKTLLNQISISFLMPLLIALIHSYFGLKELNSTIEVVGHVDASSSILITTIFILIVYGGYFMATYLYSKTIIKEK